MTTNWAPASFTIYWEFHQSGLWNDGLPIFDKFLVKHNGLQYKLPSSKHILTKKCSLSEPLPAFPIIKRIIFLPKFLGYFDVLQPDADERTIVSVKILWQIFDNTGHSIPKYSVVRWHSCKINVLEEMIS